ncbi:hypothetical protein DFH08DRAFT_841206 [Mycena albidolilacea]|uniref:Uncharacterized protein n=1 Tax=Mycena albidolilacea TaxID=1033008 RepID=A0AAD7ALY3_9AGAR|nr:hypothetical protein DFH08DRAFT_841206 [Mycena albidolilacea]
MLPASVSSTLTFPAGTPSGIGCVDPKGLLDCYSSNVDQATSCAGIVKNDCSVDEQSTCALGCANGQLAANVGCWLQHCWNRVYSCDFQATVITYIEKADQIASSVTIPFYPPPADAPGGCSCNLGLVYAYISALVVAPDQCDAYLNSPPESFAECDCCQLSAPISNIINTCPKSDLTFLSVPILIQQYAAEVQQVTSDSCQSVLGSNTSLCSSQFGISVDGGGAFFNPAALPAGVPGSEPLSTLAGSVTALPGPQTITLELFPGYSSVISLAPFDAKKVAQTAPPAAAPTGNGGSPSMGNGVSRLLGACVAILEILGPYMLTVV